ncbi:hypothetical protein KC355_g16880, partial [Hortaea werneckii]
MPIMRNPFRKQDENVKPATNDQRLQGTATAPKEIDISAKEKEPVEYKLSEINDSGVYLPPSPPAEKRRPFWATTSSSRSTTSSRSNNHRSLLNE